MDNGHVTVIGGGLAGVEAAFQAARQGVPVRLYEMRPQLQTTLHSTGLLGELSGSSCFGAERHDRASGLLMAELRHMGSVVMQAADATRIEVNGMLCVDRQAFGKYLTARIEQCPGIELCRRQADVIRPGTPTVMATGPATSAALARSLFALTDHEYLFFYGATEPLLRADSVDLEATWLQARFGQDQPVYRNLALDTAAFERFCALLAEAGSSLPEGLDVRQLGRGYRPLEIVAAEEGPAGLTSGPMNSAGLTPSATAGQPYAVCQMCPDSVEQSVLRLVNMRTGLAPEQQRRLFATINGLERVEFARHGSLHRAVYVNAPALLEATYQLRGRPDVLLAGAVTGLQGYAAVAASGWLAGVGAVRRLKGQAVVPPPPEALCGAMSHALVRAEPADFRPLHVTFGMLAAHSGTDGLSKEQRRARQMHQAMHALDRFMQQSGVEVVEL